MVVKDIGPEYDVIVHDAGSGLHLHTEFDPEDDTDWTQWKTNERIAWENRHASKA